MTAVTKRSAYSASSGTAYEQDYYTWTQEQAARLRAGDWSALDREILAEEIETLGRSEYRSLVGALRVTFVHMLKFDHQPTRATRSWAISIATQRDAVEDLLTDNPGLEPLRDDAIARAYRQARLETSLETDLPLSRFPSTRPYTPADIQSRRFAIGPDETTG